MVLYWLYKDSEIAPIFGDHRIYFGFLDKDSGCGS